MNACPLALGNEHNHYVRQGIGTVGEGFELLRTAPLECEKLIWLQSSDSATDCAVVLTIGRLPEKFVLSTHLRLDLSRRGEPLCKQIGLCEVLERPCWLNRQKRGNMNHTIGHWGYEVTAFVHTRTFLRSRAVSQHNHQEDTDYSHESIHDISLS